MSRKKNFKRFTKGFGSKGVLPEPSAELSNNVGSSVATHRIHPNPKKGHTVVITPTDDNRLRVDYIDKKGRLLKGKPIYSMNTEGEIIEESYPERVHKKKKKKNLTSLKSRVFLVNTDSRIRENERNQAFWGEYYGVIYKITDRNKDKSLQHKRVYIGQTMQPLRDRFWQHLNNQSNRYLQTAMKRYRKEFTIKIIDSKNAETNGGEFTIEVIDFAKNINEMNKMEIAYIKEYKSCVRDYYTIINNKKSPLYGYNISRGGGGFKPYREIFIDEDLLKSLIKKGFFTSEIQRELGVSEDSISRALKEARYSNITEARRELGVEEIFLQRKRFHPSHEEVVRDIKTEDLKENAEKILNFIKIGKSTEVMASLLGYSNRKAIHKIIKKIWGITFRQAERLFRIYPNINNQLIQELINDGLTIREIDEEFIKFLIYNNCEAQEATTLIERSTTSQHNILEWIRKLFSSVLLNKPDFMSDWLYLKDLYFWRPRFIEFISNGLDSNQIESELNNKLKSSTICKIKKVSNIQTKIKRIWQREFEFFISEGHQYKAFFDYLRRIYMIFPTIDAVVLDRSLRTSLTPLQIDKTLVRFLIEKGTSSGPYSSEDLVSILKLTSKISGTDAASPKYIRLFLHNLFQLNMYKVTQQFYWKPRIINLIKIGYTDIRSIANHKDFITHYRPNSLRRLFKKIWESEFNNLISQGKDFKDLLSDLIRKYKN